MKKITILALVLVLCLAAIGIGYAKWTDDITLTGSVSTGDVDLEIVDTSGTWVYKVPEHGIMVVHAWDEPTQLPEGAQLIASSVVQSWDDDTAVLVWDNLFPLGECEAFYVDMLLHYTGSIPGRLYVEFDWEGDELVADLYNGAVMARCDAYGNLINAEGEPIDVNLAPWEILQNPDLIGQVVLVDDGYQLHQCMYVYAIASLQVPQDNDFMNLEGQGILTFHVEQWAEVECPNGEPTVQ